MARLIAVLGCAVDCLFRVVLMGLKAAGLPMPVGDQGQTLTLTLTLTLTSTSTSTLTADCRLQTADQGRTSQY